MIEATDPTPYLGLGAHVERDGVRFRVYVDSAQRVEAWLYDERGESVRAKVPLVSDSHGVFSGFAAGEGHGALYRFALDGVPTTCPYARHLPFGIDGPAMAYVFRRTQRPSHVKRPLTQFVIYELHIGTFTAEGTYQAAVEKFDYLRELGVTALELMPLSSFPGKRGWGYDGVAHFAPFAPYGTPDELRTFLERAHAAGFSVLLDVVYNHFGPAGNSLAAYSSSYFSAEGDNPWGSSLNFNHVPLRAFVLDNARYWIDEIGFDGLRLDAVHAVYDKNRPSILEALVDEVQRALPEAVIIAEDDRNDPTIIESVGCDAVWADDFHHQLRVTQTGERAGYYAAYTPSVAKLAETIREGFLYRGEMYPPTGKSRGKAARDLPPQAFVYCIENHDQIGNRARGDRLIESVSIDAYCAASALLLFLPMTPLLFMGQEWASKSPFPYFCDHDAKLGEAIRAGRKREFAAMHAETPPDPQAESTFLAAKLDWSNQNSADGERVLALYRRMLQLRHTHPVLGVHNRAALKLETDGDVLVVRRTLGDEELSLVINFGRAEASWPLRVPREGAVQLIRTDGRALAEPLAENAAVLIHAHRPENAEER